MARLSPIQNLPSHILDRILVLLTGSATSSVYRDSVTSTSPNLAPPSPPDDTRDVATFRLLGKRFDRIYHLRFDSVPGILKLHDELLDHVLEYLAHDSGRLITIDHRFSLSVESFLSSPPQSVADTNATSQQRFQQLLSEAQAGTLAIEQELHQRQLKRSSGQTDRLHPSNHQLRARLARSKDDEIQIIQAMTRAENQRKIIEEEIDLQGLINALKAFTSLQQIRLLRLNDAVGDAWTDNFLVRHPNLAQEFGPSAWQWACERASKTLGRAFLESESPATRLSSRFVDPKIPLLLTRNSQQTISRLAHHLTCLEFEFNNPTNLDAKMLQLSSLFQTLFTAAVHIQGLHIGFPMHRPVSIALEAVFHNIRWAKLRYLGFGAWRLTSDEIISLLRRHRRTLRSVRLRGVLLKEGSRWLDVLHFLRRELDLQWVSLRGVGYEKWADQQATGGVNFVPVMQGQPGDDSDSDSDWEDGASEPFEGDESTSSVEDSSDESTEGGDEESDSDPADDSDAADSDDPEPPAHDTGGIDDQTLLDHSTAPSHEVRGNQIDRHDPEAACKCSQGYGMDDLEDVNDEVTKAQWKMWQDWVSLLGAHFPILLSQLLNRVSAAGTFLEEQC
ncbi:hypothetical protein B7494_g497 [Chlorociboria aeruginascens]|nr:hypothetical protein B7494_g497 [Chlorociboria aeruginascens]